MLEGVSTTLDKSSNAPATRYYRAASRAGKAKVLDELFELTGWHRDQARRALREALGRRRVTAPLNAWALRKVWAVMDASAGKGDGAIPV